LLCAYGLLGRDEVYAEDGRGKSGPPFLLRDPSISKTQIAFSYAQDIWIVRRDGTGLRRLTTDGRNVKPVLSPDGEGLVFTKDFMPSFFGGGRPGGMADRSGGLYMLTLTTGAIRQLTYHPSDLFAIGWSSDSKRVLFASRRTAFNEGAFNEGIVQLFSIPAAGGFAVRLPLPRAAEGSLSPDGSEIAYVPNIQYEPQWKHYRGGQTTPIWVANLTDSHVEARIPRDNSNDSNPMWVGENIYFLSDRHGPTTLFAYNVQSHQVAQVVQNEGFDIKAAAATNDAIVYEQFGSLHLLDLRTRREHRLDVEPSGKLPETESRVVTIPTSEMQLAGLSPTGEHALMAAHGDVFIVPTSQGSVKNLTQTDDVDEYGPAWSSDGQCIAYLSDQSGEYLLHVRTLNSSAATRKLALGDPPAFYNSLTWSPDSKKISYTDQRLNYWHVDLSTGESVRVDTDLFHGPVRNMQMVWSPDSQWLAYTRQMPNHLHAVFAYSIWDKRAYQLTDGSSDVLHIAFDASGEYLFFTASTDLGLTAGPDLPDLSGLQPHPITRAVYALVLRNGAPSPLIQQEMQSHQDDATRRGPARKVDIDLEHIERRIVTLPVPRGNYLDVMAGAAGVIFLTEVPAVDELREEGAASVRRYRLDRQESDVILHDVDVSRRVDRRASSLHVSSDGRKLLYASHGRWLVDDAENPEKAWSQELRLDNVTVAVDPRSQWRHMFQQTLRIERDHFYDPNLHGLDIQTTARRYEPFLEQLGSRADLTYLLSEVLSNLSVGHMWTYHPDQLKPLKRGQLRLGFLGADYSVAHERYRFEKVYYGDPWDAAVQGPLYQPGATVEAGEYLLAINGREIQPNTDVYSYFVGTSGTKISLTVGARPDGIGAREIRVAPIDNEAPLRRFAWAQKNRRTVDQLTGGRVAYIWLPDTAWQGLISFNRSYFGQVGKHALIVDERYGGGGAFADYFTDYLSRPIRMYVHPNFGQDVAEPQEAIRGPKVLLINEMQGSGADLFPSLFQQAGLGPLIGKRTWGGAIGATMGVELLDGWYVDTPDTAFYTPDGKWIENHGVSPDIEVDDDPQAEREGHDAQLERAVNVVLDSLKNNPPRSMPKHPPFPNYQPSAAPLPAVVP